jgi:hypothetical protein
MTGRKLPEAAEDRFAVWPTTPEEMKKRFTLLERAFLDPWPDSFEEMQRRWELLDKHRSEWLRRENVSHEAFKQTDEAK